MFVIGVSGVTCGGKTTLTHLLQRSFPWCQVIHQDSYFLDDDDPRHVRLEELNHVNYEIFESMDMEKMEKDVLEAATQENPPSYEQTNGNGYQAPNFEASGLELINNVQEFGFDNSKYRKVPILLLEGFTIFESKSLYEKCDTRFFLALSEKDCFERRSKRTTYVPPDTPGYFEKCIWPEYVAHYESSIKDNPGIHVFDGATPIEVIWRKSVEIISAEIGQKFPNLIT